MSHATERELDILLDQAESESSCLALLGPHPARLRRALQRRVRTRELVSPARGLFVRAQLWSRLELSHDFASCNIFIMNGLQALHPNWVFCGPSAAAAYGLDVSNDLLKKVHVQANRTTVPHDTSCVEYHSGASELVVRHGGLQLTPLDQTAFDCTRRCEFAPGLAILDSALRNTSLSTKDFERYLDAHGTRKHGTSKARKALLWADPRSENGGESIARARMIELGFQAPMLQLVIPHPLEQGRSYRADFAWQRSDGSILLGELDGRQKYCDPEMLGQGDVVDALTAERIRESRLDLYDVTIVRFPFGVTGSPMRFMTLLDSYGVPYRSDDGPQRADFVPDWELLRRHFAA